MLNTSNPDQKGSSLLSMTEYTFPSTFEEEENELFIPALLGNDSNLNESKDIVCSLCTSQNGQYLTLKYSMIKTDKEESTVEVDRCNIALIDHKEGIWIVSEQTKDFQDCPPLPLELSPQTMETLFVTIKSYLLSKLPNAQKITLFKPILVSGSSGLTLKSPYGTKVDISSLTFEQPPPKPKPSGSSNYSSSFLSSSSSISSSSSSSSPWGFSSSSSSSSPSSTSHSSSNSSNSTTSQNSPPIQPSPSNLLLPATPAIPTIPAILPIPTSTSTPPNPLAEIYNWGFNWGFRNTLLSTIGGGVGSINNPPTNPTTAPTPTPTPTPTPPTPTPPTPTPYIVPTPPPILTAAELKHAGQNLLELFPDQIAAVTVNRTSFSIEFHDVSCYQACMQNTAFLSYLNLNVKQIARLASRPHTSLTLHIARITKPAQNPYTPPTDPRRGPGPGRGKY